MNNLSEQVQIHNNYFLFLKTNLNNFLCDELYFFTLLLYLITGLKNYNFITSHAVR